MMIQLLVIILWIGSIVPIWKAAKKRNRNPIGWIILGMCFGPLGVVAFTLLLNSTVTLDERVSESYVAEWNALVQDARYKHFHDGTGIAVDPANQKIHLSGFFGSRCLHKTYDFSQIKEWRWSIDDNEKANTGLFVAVRDIETPDWRVSFSLRRKTRRDFKLDLQRWMEILDQTVNDAQPGSARSATREIA